MTEHWSMFIEGVFPSGLSSFFFFDGEKIAELAVEDTSEQMKDSIRALLGVQVLDCLENDLERIITKVTKVSAGEFDPAKLEHLHEKKSQAETRLQQANEEIAALEQQISKCEKALTKAKNTYSAKGGDLITRQQELFRRRSEMAAKNTQLCEGLLERASGELPLCLIHDLLEDICVRAEKEHEQRITESALTRINAMSSQFLLEFQADTPSVDRFIEFLKDHAEKERIEPIYQLSDLAWHQARHLQREQLKKHAGALWRSPNSWTNSRPRWERSTVIYPWILTRKQSRGFTNRSNG